MVLWRCYYSSKKNTDLPGISINDAALKANICCKFQAHNKTCNKVLPSQKMSSWKQCSYEEADTYDDFLFQT